MNSADQPSTSPISDLDLLNDGEPSSEQPMLFCPNCDQRLTSRRCKLLCERCGYFMSCADYY